MINMSLLISITLFVVGMCVGSFLNVLVGRFDQEDRSWYQGRSVCDHCGRQLKWWENVPVVSFVLLKGKCRTCQSPIPYQYLLVELLTGLFFAGLYLVLGLSSNFLLNLFNYLILTLLIAVVLFDLKYMIIPDYLVIALLILVVIKQLLITGFDLSNLLAALGSTSFLGLLYFITKGKGMGLGDVKFAFFMGLFLGWPEVVVAFYTAFLTGAVIGVILILMGRKKFGQLVPFGPFLVLGTFISWLWGLYLINVFFQWTKITTLSL
jgi:prepilin signal peptidase PulO-like enzyme (type II secretory pathway)